MGLWEGAEPDGSVPGSSTSNLKGNDPGPIRNDMMKAGWCDCFTLRSLHLIPLTQPQGGPVTGTGRLGGPFLSILAKPSPCKQGHTLFWTFGLWGWQWCFATTCPCVVGDGPTTSLAVTVLATAWIWTLGGKLPGHISKEWLFHLSVAHVRNLRGIFPPIHFENYKVRVQRVCTQHCLAMIKTE